MIPKTDSSSFSMGRDLFSQITKTKPGESESTSGKVKGRIAEHANHIYALLDNDETSINTEKLELYLGQLANDLRTYIRQEHTELNPLEKLQFQYAFLDITDAINEKIIEQMEDHNKKQEPESKNQGWKNWIWNTTCKAAKYGRNLFHGQTDQENEPIEDLLTRIMEYQDVITGTEHPVSLSYVKNLIDQAFTAGDENRTEALFNFLELTSLLEETHNKRAKIVQDRLGNVKKEKKTFIEAWKEEVRSYIVEKKNEWARSRAENFTPRAFFGDKSFKDLLNELTTYMLKDKDSTLFHKITYHAFKNGAKNLQDNLSVFQDERNRACLGVKMAETLTKITQAIQNLKTDATKEDLFKALGIEVDSFEKFEQKMDQQISGNLAKLITKDTSIANREKTNIAVKIWEILKTPFNEIIFRIKRRIKKRAVKKWATPTWAAGKFLEKMPKFDIVAAKLIGSEQVEKFTNLSDVLMLYLIQEMTAEAARISKEAQSNPEKIVAGFEEQPDANKKFEKSVEEFTQQLAKFQEENGGFVQKGLSKFANFFGQFVIAQGNSDSILDLATPALEVLLPAWKSWFLQPESPEKLHEDFS